ncbi:MAG: chemotaxis protein CheB [Thermomonas sp.]
MSSARRVVLLARPGPARERLVEAAREAGAELALVADPIDADPDAVRDARPEALLVALEPAVESAIERFEGIYSDPDVIVLFEEADFIVQREGWDAARWLRHVAAKLRMRDTVLPDGAEPAPPEEELPRVELERPSLYQRPEWDGDIGGLAEEVESVFADVPSDALLDPNAPRTMPEAAAPMTVPPLMDPLRSELDAIHMRAAKLELEDAPREEIAASRGMVAVLAGLGGPDAVRQLLGALPADFAPAVFIHQQLDGARHDKLLRQMQRATTLPLVLAEGGMAPEPGHVYLVPGELGIAAGNGGMRFLAGAHAFSQLTAGDSAIVALSGTDPAQVDAIMAQSWAGALVLAQLPSGCYEPAAVQALIARGVAADTPQHLASQLAKRWPERKGSET